MGPICFIFKPFHRFDKKTFPFPVLTLKTRPKPVLISSKVMEKSRKKWERELRRKSVAFERRNKKEDEKKMKKIKKEGKEKKGTAKE